MKEIKRKFISSSFLLLSITIFVFNLIVYFFSRIALSWPIVICALLLLSIILSLIIFSSFVALNHTISDAMITLRRLDRADNLSNPLIMRLSTEAPGTYHHSLNVSNLAQRAAKSIGCDSYLARIASYYHDIGKIHDPKVFVENQTGNEIPQEENSSWIKSNVKKIISHTSSGVKIAKESNLSDDIINIIASHHGTTRAIYFFELAKEKKLKIKKTDFSYPGPKPSSRESACVMLADCVEASSRAEPLLNQARITEIVSNVLEEKIKEGQLSEAKLFEKDYGKIRDSFIETLGTIYHQRISYHNHGKN